MKLHTLLTIATTVCFYILLSSQFVYSCEPFINSLECKTDHNCATTELCSKGKCISICKEFKPCGPGATCYSAENHAYECFCPKKLSGDPYDKKIGCTSKCTIDSDCATTDTCSKGKCISICEAAKPCGPGAECRSTKNVIFECFCPKERSGNPYDRKTGCISKCTVDKECKRDERCLNGKCANYCHHLEPCGPHAFCNNTGEHYSECVCLDGLEGRPYDRNVGCNKKKIPPQCEYDHHCVDSEKCLKGKCVNICKVFTPCKPDASCHPVYGHSYKCMYHNGQRGDPYEIHNSNHKNLGECQFHDECAKNENCVSSECVNISKFYEPCKINAIHNTWNSVYQCLCPPEYIAVNDPTPICMHRALYLQRSSDAQIVIRQI